MRPYLHEVLYAPSDWWPVTALKRTVWLLCTYCVALFSFAGGIAAADAYGLSGNGVTFALLCASMGAAGLFVALTVSPGDRVRISREARSGRAHPPRVEPSFLPAGEPPTRQWEPRLPPVGERLAGEDGAERQAA